MSVRIRTHRCARTEVTGLNRVARGGRRLVVLLAPLIDSPAASGARNAPFQGFTYQRLWDYDDQRVVRFEGLTNE